MKSMIYISIISLCWWRKNIILLLLSLELLLLSLFILISLNSFTLSTLSLLCMLTIMVAGSSLGLTMLVSLCRFFKSPSSTPLWMLI